MLKASEKRQILIHLDVFAKHLLSTFKNDRTQYLFRDFCRYPQKINVADKLFFIILL